MCYYKRATYSHCNHSQWSAQPTRECPVQRDYAAGRAREPCDTARGHPLATVKVEGRCAACRGVADHLDERLRRAKDIISVSKQTLIGADERCRAILEDVGIDVPLVFSDDEGDGDVTPRSSSFSPISPGTHTHTNTVNNKTSAVARSPVEEGIIQVGLEDSSAQEFLRKRREQKDSGLYMR
ncbi:hypothetical protein PG985_007219 [Apiospora marii]|uniref:HMA domain-containing protein n=1 Tax=Apiospora marii TaxID=335849 RepID=A0ABR1SG01_9PEZI